MGRHLEIKYFVAARHADLPKICHVKLFSRVIYYAFSTLKLILQEKCEKVF